MEMDELERISEFGAIFGGNDVIREEMDVGGLAWLLSVGLSPSLSVRPSLAIHVCLPVGLSVDLLLHT